VPDECYSPEILAELADAPLDDPRRAHLESCPRCRAQLAAYRKFMQPGELPAGAKLPDAEARLDTALSAEIFPAEAGSEVVTESAEARAPGGLIGHWFSDPSRRLLSLAAVLVVAMGIVVLTDVGDSPRRAPVLREDSDPITDSFTARATTLADGRLQISWSGVAGADGYQIGIFGTDLAEMTRFDAGTDVEMVLDLADLLAGEETVIWQVIALRGGDEIARSDPLYLSGP